VAPFEHHGDSAPSAAADVAAPAADGACPPPLAWEEVVGEFHRQSEAWYLDRQAYRLSGRILGSGPTLYFLNGFTGTHELYALLVWLLRDEFRCVLIDYPSPAGPHLTLHGLADDLVAVADTCRDQSFDLFAASFGGLVALNAMHRHPDRIRRAVLAAGFAHRRYSVAERMLVRLCGYAAIPLGRCPLRTTIQLQNHRRWFPPFDTTRWNFFSDNTGATRLTDLAQRAALACDADLRTVLPNIRQPVLLVRSEGDGEVLESCSQVLAGSLPDVRLEPMHGTGQIPFLTHPHRLAKALRSFLLG